MKTFLKLLVPFSLVALLVGCGTTLSTVSTVTPGPNGTLVTNLTTITNTTLAGIVITPTSVYNTLRGGTAVSAKIAMSSDTNSVTYLKAVRDVLGAALNGTNLNTAQLTADINAIPLSSIHNPTAVEAIDAGFAAFEMLQPILDAQINAKNKFIIPALQGVYDGIGDALGIAAPMLQPSANEPALVIPRNAYSAMERRLEIQSEPTPSLSAGNWLK